ncbi:hypothetical protein [Haloarcula halophila]|uniref:hypothetical protein n=1 Tax=Haloarcula TaxID=2237 RepID=UPI0023E374D4|nr:hypothetical protein [Halomicroarcula sp. DFY41]
MIDIDGVRARDLNVFGALAIVLASGLAVVAVRNATGLLLGFSGVDVDLTVGAAVGAVVLAGLAYQQATPDLDAVCDGCGDHLRLNTGTDTEDTVVTIRKAGAPQRARIGPISLVTETQRAEREYCSPQCADLNDVAMIPLADDESQTVKTSVATGGDD